MSGVQMAGGSVSFGRRNSHQDFLAEPESERESLPGSLILPTTEGMNALESYIGSSFSSDQDLLSKNFCSRFGSRQKSLVRTSGVGGGG